MKIKDGFLLREVAGSNIVVPLGRTELDFGGMMTLNEVGAFVWNCLTENTDEASVTAAVCREYDVDEATAARDVHIYIEKLREKGLLEA